jgi:hypothetical protein
MGGRSLEKNVYLILHVRTSFNQQSGNEVAGLAWRAIGPRDLATEAEGKGDRPPPPT